MKDIKAKHDSVTSISNRQHIQFTVLRTSFILSTAKLAVDVLQSVVSVCPLVSTVAIKQLTSDSDFLHVYRSQSYLAYTATIQGCAMMAACFMPISL